MEIIVKITERQFLGLQSVCDQLSLASVADAVELAIEELIASRNQVSHFDREAEEAFARSIVILKSYMRF